MRKNEKGFGLVEILLVTVVIGLLVAVGRLFFDRQKDKQDNKVTNTQQTIQKTEEKSVEMQKDYLEIKELGLKFDKSLVPTAYYKINESERMRSYRNVPEYKFIELYDSSYDNTTNSKGEKCGNGDSSVIVLQVISVADRDSKYAQYKNQELGPNDEVPTVVSDKYAKRVGNYLYDYYKAQGVQAPVACDSATGDDTKVQQQFKSSYDKLEQMIGTISTN